MVHHLPQGCQFRLKGRDDGVIRNATYTRMLETKGVLLESSLRLELLQSSYFNLVEFLDSISFKRRLLLLEEDDFM